MNVYEVTLNWHGEIHTFFTSARSKIQAKCNAMKRLSEELEMNLGIVRKHFKYESNNWKVVER